MFDLAWDAEDAAARKEATATTIIDFKRYYEYLRVDEYVRGGLRVGLPKTVMTLAVYLYLGPRHIRCGEAVAAALYPRRSILAGCTWATLLIRIIMAEPTDQFFRVFNAECRAWQARPSMTIYVDDGAVTTMGHASAVEYVHAWASRLLLQWVRVALQKEVAQNKLKVIVSDKELRKTLRKKLEPEGFQVDMHGELLGTDYGAGRKLVRRRVQNKRRWKMRKRRSTIAWWHSLGGNARAVVRDGAWSQGRYGSDVVGIPPPLRRDMRRMCASVARVRCAGSSLTSKLAFGGENFDDIDPAVLYCAPPMQGVLSKVWDDVRARAVLVKMWLHARTDFTSSPAATHWKLVRGPVGAAMLHLWRAGCDWHKPFWIRALGQEIDLLKVPPLQVMSIIREQARITLDITLVKRLCTERGWDSEAVASKYCHGIDWDELRSALRRDSGLVPAESFALHVVACGGFWAEERKHAAGLRDDARCDACRNSIGSDLHCLHECPSLYYPMARVVAEGRIKPSHSLILDEALAPLAQMALPPRSTSWSPAGTIEPDGTRLQNYENDVYGDGSGRHQNSRNTRCAAWSVVSLAGEGDHEMAIQSILAGGVAGWFPTAPRGELSAVIEFLRHAHPNAVYWGDCKHVVDIVNCGVPPTWASSSSINADLWGEARRLLEDHGCIRMLRKIRAHRARSSAAAEGSEAERAWFGNDAADKAAKDLSRRMLGDDSTHQAAKQSRQATAAVLRRIGVAAALALKTRPSVRRRQKGLGDKKSRPLTNEERHDFRRRLRGGWECAKCHAYWLDELARRVAERSACAGDVSQKVHLTHDVRVTSSGALWCSKCGCYSTRWPRRLRMECPRQPQSEAQWNVKRRLHNDLPPTTARYLQEEAGFGDGQNVYSDVRAQCEGRIGHASSRARSTLVGMYLRLAGGPLHCASREGRSSHASSGGAEGGSHQLDGPSDDISGDRTLQSGNGSAASVQAPPPFPGATVRRRLNVKTRPFGEATRGPLPTARCSAAARASWSSRLAIGRLPGRPSCNICKSGTRTSCRGCSRPLCFLCAKGHKMCNEFTSSAEAS